MTGIKKRILSDLLLKYTLFQKYKRNVVVNKFLLTGDKFISKMHLKHPGFTYSDCVPFTKKENNKKIKKTGD